MRASQPNGNAMSTARMAWTVKLGWVGWAMLWLAAMLLTGQMARDLHAQESVGDHGFHYDGPSPAPLTAGTPQAKRAQLLTYGMAARIGGLHFGAVARPGPDIADRTIHLFYDPRQTDGSRLIIVMGQNRYHAKIFDWQLLPIARFADTPHAVVLTIYGEGADPHNYYYFRYHAAFLDTLLGLRLLQAEILLMDTYAFWPLPMPKGRIVQGKGEAPAPTTIPHEAILALSKAMRRDRFRSWVLTDANNHAYVRGINALQGVVLDNTPYYLFWSASAEIDNRLASRRALLEELRASQLNLNDLIAVYNGAVEGYNRSPDTARYTRVKELQADVAVEQQAVAGIYARITALDQEMAGLPVEEVPQVTQGVRDRDDRLRNLNPAVWDAVVTTAEYAAFFRYVRKHNPAGWQTFMGQIARVSLTPVKTPTHMDKPKQ